MPFRSEAWGTAGLADLGRGENSHRKPSSQNSRKALILLSPHMSSKRILKALPTSRQMLSQPQKGQMYETRLPGAYRQKSSAMGNGTHAHGCTQGLCSPPCQSTRPLSVPDPRTMTHGAEDTYLHPPTDPPLGILASALYAHSLLAWSAEPIPVQSTWTPILTVPSPDPSPGGFPTFCTPTAPMPFLGLQQPGNQSSGRRHTGVPAQQREQCVSGAGKEKALRTPRLSGSVQH